MAGQDPSKRAPADTPAANAALDSAYRQHGGWLLDFLRRRFGRDAAEDLAQETYVRLARSHSDPRSPKALLAVTALNAARDQARRRAVRPRLVQADALPDPSAPSTQVENVLLKQVVMSLPRNLRAVFLLSRFGGMTNDEVAQHCGVSVKTVEARITRALKICALRLRD